MAYCKAKLKSNGDTASLCFSPFCWLLYFQFRYSTKNEMCCRGNWWR
jgi:hypothetical protein